jgi:hypothetical protein
MGTGNETHGKAARVNGQGTIIICGCLLRSIVAEGSTASERETDRCLYAVNLSFRGLKVTLPYQILDPEKMVFGTMGNEDAVAPRPERWRRSRPFSSGRRMCPTSCIRLRIARGLHRWVALTLGAGTANGNALGRHPLTIPRREVHGPRPALFVGRLSALGPTEAGRSVFCTEVQPRRCDGHLGLGGCPSRNPGKPNRTECSRIPRSDRPK